MSINQDSTTHNHGPNPASFNRSGILSTDNSHLAAPRFGGQPKPLEYHSMMSAASNQGNPDNYRSFQQVQSGLSIKREVKFRWDNQQDCVQVDRKSDYKATFLLTNLSSFPWKAGLTFVLHVGDEKREAPLTAEVKMQDDTKCEFDLREFADRKLRDTKIELCCAGASTDPLTGERTKYFSERIPIGKIEFK